MKLSKIIRNKFFSLILLIVLTSFSVYHVNALSVGVSPVSIEFGNMLRGGYAERSITISTSDSRDLTGHFIILGDIADWIRLEPTDREIILSSSKPYRLKVIAEPPVDAANGVYRGEIRFLTDSVAAPDGTTGSAVRASVTVTIEIKITDQQVMQCSYGTINLPDTEIGLPLELTWLTRNSGNVRFQPKVSIDIWDRDKTNLYFSREFLGTDVLPTTEKTFVQKISTERMPQGQYWAYISIKECSYSYTTTFDILEKGSISDKGELLSVSAPPWVYVGDIVPIKAKFQNNGVRNVNAKFKGEIKDADKIIQLIESEETVVPKGETVDLTVFFEPKSEGKYTVNGKVIYNKKITYEKSTIINVMKQKFLSNYSNFLLLGIYVIILIAIIFLIRKIRKSKKTK